VSFPASFRSREGSRYGPPLIPFAPRSSVSVSARWGPTPAADHVSGREPLPLPDCVWQLFFSRTGARCLFLTQHLLLGPRRLSPNPLAVLDQIIGFEFRDPPEGDRLTNRVVLNRGLCNPRDYFFFFVPCRSFSVSQAVRRLVFLLEHLFVARCAIPLLPA